MAWNPDNVPPFVFVIDTDQYAGNFEREMCAFVTGHIGECGVGQQYQKLFFDFLGLDVEQRDDNPFFEQVVDMADDHGCFRPVSIWPTKGRVNDGHGNCYDEDSEEAKKLKQTYGAYESVGIFFRSEPSRALINLMKERVQEFCKLEPLRSTVPENIKIRGFRLIKVSLVFGEVSV